MICLQEVAQSGKEMVLKCGHQFHIDCIGHWCLHYKNECPVCRRSPVLKIELDPQTRGENNRLVNEAILESFIHG